jgi:hypothetical protein
MMKMLPPAANRSLKGCEKMRFAGESACATTGKSAACKGGAGASACQPRLPAIFSQLLRERLAMRGYLRGRIQVK